MSTLLPKREGWLEKKGNVWQAWRRRYMVLEEGLISYYKNADRTNKSGTIEIVPGSQVTKSQESKRFIFTVTPPNRADRSFVAGTESASERDAWVEDINLVLDLLSDRRGSLSSSSSTVDPTRLPDEHTRFADNEYAQRVRLLVSKSLSRDRRIDLLTEIYDSFMTYDSNFVTRADAYVDGGMIPLCYDIEKRYGEEEKIKAIYILGMFCFNNERAATIVGEHSGFLDLLQRSLDPTKSEALMRAGLYLMTNTSSNSYSTHSHLVSMLPRLRDILDEASGFDQGPRSEAVRVCFYLSSNDETKSRMLDAAVIDPLVAIMASGVLALDCVSAAIAVANLVGDEEDSPALAAGAGAHGFYQLLIDALEAALNGTDYPVGSNLWYRNWKIVQGLANLSKADINKEKLGASGLIPLLKRALDMDDTDALLHKYSVLTLWNLSFDGANARRMKENGSLRLEIERLKDFGTSEEIRRAAQGIMWQLDSLDREYSAFKRQPERSFSGRVLAKAAGHVMCSYSTLQQEIMVEIKEALESRGFRVWMDVDRMHDSTLESMANAVEGADAVLIGVSKDYKNSGACRTEGEFAYQLNRPIVPILLEPGYVPDGWLGALVGGEQFLDFSDEKRFDANVNLLVKALGAWGRIGAPTSSDDDNSASQLRPVVEHAAAPSPATSLTSSSQTHQSQPQAKAKPMFAIRNGEKEQVVERMTSDEVCKWLAEISLEGYVDVFQQKHVDGQVLVCANMILCNDSDGHSVVLEDFRREFSMKIGDSYRFLWNLKLLCSG